MNSRLIKILFLIPIAICSLYYSGKAIYLTVHYQQLDTLARVEQLKLESIEGTLGRYALTADYQFVAAGKVYKKNEQLDYPVFRNSWSAEQFIDERSDKPTTVWYYSKNPNHSSLQKSFPLKECIYALLIVLLTIYFIAIVYYANNYSGKNNGNDNSQNNHPDKPN